jgi:AbrB family looped-hinge helix DNA binding protein
VEKTHLSCKGQIVIPKPICVRHGWQLGEEFIIEEIAEGILLKPIKRFPRTTLKEVSGCLSYRGPQRSLADMNEAISRGAKEHE